GTDLERIARRAHQPVAPRHLDALAADLLIDPRRALAELAERGPDEKGTVGSDLQLLDPAVRDLNSARVAARFHDELLLEAPPVAIELGADACPAISVADAGLPPDASPPLRGVVADEVVVDARPRRAALDASREICADQILREHEPLLRGPAIGPDAPVARLRHVSIGAWRLAV